MDATRLVVAFVVLAVAGCSQPPAVQHKGSIAGPLDLAYGSEAIPGPGGLRIVLVAMQDSMVNVSFDNGYVGDGFAPARQDCGEVTTTRMHGGNATLLGRSRWSQTGGHALVLRSGAANQSVPLDRATDDYGGDADASQHLHQVLAQGDRLVIDFGVRDLASPRYDLALNVSSPRDVLVETTEPYVFRCGAGLEDFGGDFVWTGTAPAALFATKGAALHLAIGGVRVRFDLQFDFFFTGSCTAILFVDGAEKARSEGLDAPCHLQYSGEADELVATLDASASAAPEVRYFLSAEPQD